MAVGILSCWKESFTMCEYFSSVSVSPHTLTTLKEGALDILLLIRKPTEHFEFDSHLKQKLRHLCFLALSGFLITINISNYAICTTLRCKQCSLISIYSLWCYFSSYRENVMDTLHYPSSFLLFVLPMLYLIIILFLLI